MMDRLTIEEFQAKLNKPGARISFERGTPNPDTRDGVYVVATLNLATASFFVGVDKTTNEFVIERAV